MDLEIWQHSLKGISIGDHHKHLTVVFLDGNEHTCGIIKREFDTEHDAEIYGREVYKICNSMCAGVQIQSDSKTNLFGEMLEQLDDITIEESRNIWNELIRDDWEPQKIADMNCVHNYNENIAGVGIGQVSQGIPTTSGQTWNTTIPTGLDMTGLLTMTGGTVINNIASPSSSDGFSIKDHSICTDKLSMDQLDIDEASISMKLSTKSRDEICTKITDILKGKINEDDIDNIKKELETIKKTVFIMEDPNDS